MMKKKQPEAGENAESLISSDTLPDWSEIDKIYEAEFAALAEEDKTNENKKKACRSKKAIETQQAATQSGEDTGASLQVVAEDIEDWTAFPLNAFFERTGRKSLGKIERIAWSRSCAQVINKYVPMAASKYGAEIGLCVCLGAIFAVRMKPPEVEKGPEEVKADVH